MLGSLEQATVKHFLQRLWPQVEAARNAVNAIQIVGALEDVTSHVRSRDVEFV